MTTKVLRVTMPNGDIWDVLAHLIAHERAVYYANRDHGEDDSKEKLGTYTEEYEYAMDDEGTLIDWAEGNMDWKDVAKYATLIESAAVDLQEGWVNGDKEVVEI